VDAVDGLLAGVREQLALAADARPRRRIAVVTCMDARIDPLRILGLEPGDAHVIRNAGGAVTEDVVDSVAVSQRLLGTRSVIVLHHTDCAGMASRLPGVPPAETLREAVEILREEPGIPHRAWVSGALWDTARHTLIVRPGAVPAGRAPPAPPRVDPSAQHLRCAWCGRPFGGVATARRDARRRYCGDLCRIAARRGVHRPH
jgi:carbonic anhydrase